MKIYIAHQTNINYKEEICDKIRASVLNERFNIILPYEDNARKHNLKEELKTCDYIIADVSTESFEIGMELGRALIYGMNIICVHKNGTRISEWLKEICDNFIGYDNMDDLINKLVR